VQNAGFLRRLAAAAYDGLLLLAVLFVAAFLFLFLLGSAVKPPLRYVFQAYLLAISALYFIWFWTHGGQTLAMRTWRIRLVTVDGQALGLNLGIKRFVLALANLALFGAGWWWGLVDRERCFLHDRLAGTRQIRA
jgi:uncharacterized RDD family membrane protein YckC